MCLVIPAPADDKKGGAGKEDSPAATPSEGEGEKEKEKETVPENAGEEDANGESHEGDEHAEGEEHGGKVSSSSGLH